MMVNNLWDETIRIDRIYLSNWLSISLYWQHEQKLDTGELSSSSRCCCTIQVQIDFSFCFAYRLYLWSFHTISIVYRRFKLALFNNGRVLPEERGLHLFPKKHHNHHDYYYNHHNNNNHYHCCCCCCPKCCWHYGIRISVEQIHSNIVDRRQDFKL